MDNIVMGNLDGDLKRIAFDMQDIKQIIHRDRANLVFSDNGTGLYLEVDGHVSPVQGNHDKETIKSYFIVLNSGATLNTSDYQILFNVKELENHLIKGTDSSGREHLCQMYRTVSENRIDPNENIINELDEKLRTGDLSEGDTDAIKDMIHKLRDGEFFELLTMEFSGKIKDVAKELIDFRKDIQKKLEPEIVEIASKDIPEASNQLGGINETLEDSTMKIMDINEDQMETANKQLKVVESFLNNNGHPDETAMSISLDDALGIIAQQRDVLKEIEGSSLKMMEPLSFQDLVGQRIQKIIKLVRSMELRIEELIVSFGIRLQKHKEDPTKTYAELNYDVEAYMMDLKGPLRAGEGLDQAGIDDLLANL